MKLSVDKRFQNRGGKTTRPVDYPVVGGKAILTVAMLPARKRAIFEAAQRRNVSMATVVNELIDIRFAHEVVAETQA